MRGADTRLDAQRRKRNNMGVSQFFRSRLRLTVLLLIAFAVLGILGVVIYRISGGNTTPENAAELQQNLSNIFGR